MKWVTREHVKVDRVACPWLIRKFVDPQAQFLFVPPEQVLEVARREGAIPYDVTGAELGIIRGSAALRRSSPNTRLMIRLCGCWPRSCTARMWPRICTGARRPPG